MNEKIKKAEGKMTKSVDRLKGEFAAIRAGRANPAVLDKAMVDYYGVPVSYTHPEPTRLRRISDAVLWV